MKITGVVANFSTVMFTDDFIQEVYVTIGPRCSFNYGAQRKRMGWFSMPVQKGRR
jgi:hypothetical protein